MIKSMNVAWWVARWAEINPDKPVIHFGGTTISYAELHQRAEATACWLQDQGIEKGDRVAVLLTNCPQFLEMYLACARLGAIFVPCNFRLATPEIDFLLQSCRPRLFVYSQSLAEKVAPLYLKRYQPPLASAIVEPECEINSPGLDRRVLKYWGRTPFVTSSLGPSDPQDPQVIMYTSGTTGRPKGAVLTYAKTFFNCLNANIFFKLTHDDVMLVLLPLFHSGGLFIQATPCLYHGATMVIHPRFEAAKAYEDMERLGVTKFLGVPTVYRALLEAPHNERSGPDSLKVCAIGGEKVTPELIQQCRDAGFWPRQIMGQTETSILLWASEEEGISKPGTVGRPVFHAEVKLRGKGGKSVPTGEVGEIVVRGPVVMKEYWREPERTEEALAGGWLRTGDLARMDEDGYFYLMDRLRDMYITGGENVYPADVERALRLHELVADAAIIGIPDEKWGEVGHAFVIPEPGADLDEPALKEHCRNELAAYKIPKAFTFCREFPRTPLGKVRKYLLKKQLALPSRRQS